jgi:hypothetical protein
LIRERQQGRADSLDVWRKEIESWEPERLNRELEQWIGVYDKIPQDARDEDEVSILLLDFTRVFQAERQFMLDRICDLAELPREKYSSASSAALSQRPDKPFCVYARPEPRRVPLLFG